MYRSGEQELLGYRTPMYILGLATMGESAAALLKDGILVAAAEEERFTRVKHEGCFPVRSIRYCLASEGIDLSEVDHVGVYWQPLKVGVRARSILKQAFTRPANLAIKFDSLLKEFTPAGGGARTNTQGSWLELFFVRSLLQRHFGSRIPRIHYLDHHRCHLALAFFTSPFEEATLLVFDGAGEEVSTTLAIGQGTDMRVLRTIPWPHSLGHFYASMTGFLGFGMHDGEYKMMGLAPYNSPDFAKFIRRHILVSDSPGSYRLNSDLLDYHAALRGRFSPALLSVFGSPREAADAAITENHEKLASSAQTAFEEVVSDLASWAFQHGDRLANLAVAGGCALNCAANGSLLRQGLFDKLYVPPAPHDAGCAIGAALLVHHEVLGHPRRFQLTHAYYGPEYSDQDIRVACESRGLEADHIPSEDDLLRRTTDLLCKGGIVAWFQGRMEVGPRALGARSLLADPRNRTVRRTINDKIKERETFRPFAPSVKEERAGDFFDLSQNSPFMNLTVPVRLNKRSSIPAVTHVDGTARVQTVNRKDNPRYWKLLDSFEKKTGVPVLLNTSFNIQEPIVCTPDQALETFSRSGIDALVIGNYFLDRTMLCP